MECTGWNWNAKVVFVALRFLPSDVARFPQALGRFRREASASSSWNSWKVDPGRAFAQRSAANRRSTENGYQNARKYFNLAIQLEPEYADAVVGLAETYITKDPAEQILQRLVRQDPNIIIAHRHLVRIYAAREQIPEYVTEILKSNGWYKGNSEELEASFRQLRAAYTSGRPQAFWPAYAEREINGPTTMHPLGLARIYADAGDRDHCIAILQELYMSAQSLEEIGFERATAIYEAERAIKLLLSPDRLMIFFG